jgi:glyoxylase-like metal-dependent hydrolase (beta-lactamase superfamily II)
VNFTWDRLGESVFRCRLPFLDVTIGMVQGRTGTLLIDAGTTLTEARAIDRDVRALTGSAVSHILLTHHHFDHVLGSSVFGDAAVYCAPEVAATMVEHTDHLRADAVSHGADADEVDCAIAALTRPDHLIRSAIIDLGDLTVSISHPGRGHTDHDLIVIVPVTDRTVVFCGDLVEESGDPSIDADSDVASWPATLDRVLAAGGEDAVFVPGHGAVVDAAFIGRQQDWLRAQR